MARIYDVACLDLLTPVAAIYPGSHDIYQAMKRLQDEHPTARIVSHSVYKSAVWWYISIIYTRKIPS